MKEIKEGGNEEKYLSDVTNRYDYFETHTWLGNSRLISRYKRTISFFDDSIDSDECTLVLCIDRQAF